MKKWRGNGIPAASIGDTDLASIARTSPHAAEEIARLEERMHRGEESKEEFLRLCELLFDVGSTAAAEFLLRRNLDFYEGQNLYARLFGTEKQEEFDNAIDVFGLQFDLELTLLEHESFLVSIFHSKGSAPRSDVFSLLSRPCEIKIAYIEQDTVEADIVLLDPDRQIFGPDENMLMYFVNGVWEIAEH